MQTLWSYANSIREAYNSINPATLTGAIDVVVVEHPDGTLFCSPFHVRFGKYQILRPSQKRVEFRVNDVKQDIPMKLAEGGEAFFVIETTENIAPGYQTSPLVSPASSPKPLPAEAIPSVELAEPEPLDLTSLSRRNTSDSENGDVMARARPVSSSSSQKRPVSAYMGDRPPPMLDLPRATTDDVLPSVRESFARTFEQAQLDGHRSADATKRSRSNSPPPVSQADAMTRAINLSKKLFSAKIPTKITETGDLMLDMTGYKTTTEEALEIEVMARKVLQEELEGNFDIGSLISVDQNGNIWIYSSEEAKEAADRRASLLQALNPTALRSADAISDPGYHSDDGQSETELELAATISHLRRDSDSAVGLSTPPASPGNNAGGGDGVVNYAKSLRLGHEMLKSLDLKPGVNSMSFSVNKATCHGFIYLWRCDTPIVISDIDGTITKSDALGHVLNAVGRDWTHTGVAKLYTDIAANGYNILYLTSRSIGQADTTRNYLAGIAQDGYKLPRGPVILSPDRTIAALRREVIIKKPEIFKMGCLRDIRDLYFPDRTASKDEHAKTPFYAGFGNRLNDALSYRSVAIPATRIFTINSNAEVSMHLLTLNSYRTSYVSMRELVDHYFPPVGLLVKDGGEQFTDFSYWRDALLDVDEFSASESESSGDEDEDEEDRGYRPSIDEASLRSEDEGDEEGTDMEASRFSRDSIDETGNMEDSIMASTDGGGGGDGESLQNSVLLGSASSVAGRKSEDDDGDGDELSDAESLTGGVDKLSLADKTPRARPRDPQDDLKDLATVLSTPERDQIVVNGAIKQKA